VWSGVDALEVTSQYISVIKPNQDSEERITRVDHKAKSISMIVVVEDLIILIY
jgi:hypothetical protein